MILNHQDKPLQTKLEFIKSDSSFDYYSIKISNKSNSLAGILYDPAAFDPSKKNDNRLFCGGSNDEDKWYDAILYNMDHLEISSVLEIPANISRIIYVKWDRKYAAWKKSLSLLYYWTKNEGNFVINDVDAKYISVDFPNQP